MGIWNNMIRNYNIEDVSMYKVTSVKVYNEMIFKLEKTLKW